MDERRKTRGRKLLAATLGLATVTLTGCTAATSGNLVAPPPDDSGIDAGEESDAGEETDAGEESDADTGGK